MAGSGSERKECWYALLGVERTSSPEEIRSAYRREALKWHPDKIQQSGASPEEATARFQKIAQAYEVLSDATERAWYDKYRSEILASGIPSKDFEFNVFSFFSPSAFSGYGGSGKGFYKVYKDVFVNIHKKEQAFARAYDMDPIGEVPSFGTPGGPYAEVEDFYKYWTGFSTVKDFAWCDVYSVAEGPNRYSRRRAEEENAKLRKRGRREFNEAVRDLATFVKKRDKRWLERVVEIQRLQKEKDLQFKLKKQQLQQEKLAKALAFEEQEWTKIPDSALHDDDGVHDVNEGSYTWKGSRKNKVEEEELEEFYCIVCSKRFRSEKQWKNHEQSKKHMERASALKQSFLDEDQQTDSLVRNSDVEKETNEAREGQNRTAANGSEGDAASKDDDTEEVADSMWRGNGGASVEGLHKRDSETLQKGSSMRKSSESSGQRNNFYRLDENLQEDEGDESLEEDDEDSMLAAMMNSHKSRLGVTPAEIDVTLVVDSHEILDDSREQSGGGSSSDSADEEKASDANEDGEDSMLASILRSLGSQSRLSTDDQRATERPEEEVMSSHEAESEDRSEEESIPKSNVGKRHSRKKSTREKNHLASRERHNDLVKELSSPPQMSKLSNHDDSDAEREDSQTETGLSVEDVEEVSIPAMSRKSKKLQRGQKKSKLEIPGKLAVQTASATVSQVGEHMGKKGNSKGKKGKGATKLASNTCDTCGEAFDSRSQLFRHISVSNHATLKSR